MTTERNYFRKEFLEYMVRYLVEEPEKVQVDMTEGQETIIFEVKVANSDIGFVIGKHGRNIDAIRTLISAIGGRGRKRVRVEVISEKRTTE